MMDCCGRHRAQVLSRRGMMRSFGLGGAALACTAVAGTAWAEEEAHAPAPVRRAAPRPRPAAPAAAPAHVTQLPGPTVVASPEPPHGCDVLLLTCMDFRLQDETVNFMEREGLRNNYDHIVLAGASLGVQTRERPDWSRAFWDHLDTAIKLHGVKKVMILDHFDCGAYKVFLGEAAVKEPKAELTAHTQRLRLLRSAINVQNAMLEVELGIMSLDGNVMSVT